MAEPQRSESLFFRPHIRAQVVAFTADGVIANSPLSREIAAQLTDRGRVSPADLRVRQPSGVIHVVPAADRPDYLSDAVTDRLADWGRADPTTVRPRVPTRSKDSAMPGAPPAPFAQLR